MSNQLLLEDFAPMVKDIINNQGKVTFTVTGWSMQPMVYHRRDTVTLVKPKFPLKKYDLPFFCMDDGEFIMHRVIRINKDGTYECRGDNRWISEDNIRNDQIIGVVESFTRNGKVVKVDKSFLYYLYTRTWFILHPFKKLYNAPKRFKELIKRKIFLLKDIQRNFNKVKFDLGNGNVKKIEFRPAYAVDMKSIYNLHKELCIFEVENFNDQLIDFNWSNSEDGQIYFQRIRKEHFLWVAVDNNKTIAFIAGNIPKVTYSKEKVANLLHIYVKQEYRGLGIADRLIDIFKDYCNSRDCKNIKITVNEKNIAAYNLYKKKGFANNTKTLLCELD